MPLPSAGGSLTNDELIRLFLDINTDSAATATLRVDELGKALEKSTNKMAGFGQSALQTGRVVQDFTQGGIGGILNNIEGLSQALGGGAGLAGVLTILGVAAFLAKPYLSELWNGITGAGSNEVPKATDAVKRLGEEIKVNKDRLEELAKQHKLTNVELAEFNRLTAAQKTLEEDLEFARERAKQKKDAQDKLKKAAGADEADAAKERAENLGITLGGSQRELEVDLFRNLGAQGKAAEAQLMDEISRTPPGEERDNLLRQLVKIKRASAAGPNRLANIRDLEGGAIGQGNLNDINALMRLLPKGSQFRGAFQGVQPDAMEAANAAEQEAIDEGERLHRGAGKFRRAKQQQIDQDKLSNKLSEEGNQIQNEMFLKLDRDKEHDKIKAEHDATKAKHKAEHDARQNTPEAINRRQQEALDNEALGYVQRAMPGAMPGPQAAVAKHMVENYQAGLALGHTIQEQIDYAVMQTRTEMTHGIQAGLKRSGQQTESRMSP